jgi:hypothetical protein
MSTRTTKGKAAASSSTAPTQKETPQVSAAQEDPERQLESDYDDAPEEASSRTLRNQVQELARNQSHTETVLQLILQRITELNDGQKAQELIVINSLFYYTCEACAASRDRHVIRHTTVCPLLSLLLLS